MPSSLSIGLPDWAYGGAFVRFAALDFGIESVSFSWKPEEVVKKFLF